MESKKKKLFPDIKLTEHLRRVKIVRYSEIRIKGNSELGERLTTLTQQTLVGGTTFTDSDTARYLRQTRPLLRKVSRLFTVRSTQDFLEYPCISLYQQNVVQGVLINCEKSNRSP